MSFRCTCGLSVPSALSLWRGICIGRGKVHFSTAWCPLPVGRNLVIDSVSRIPEKTAHLEMSSGSSSIEAEEKREPAITNKQKKISVSIRIPPMDGCFSHHHSKKDGRLYFDSSLFISGLIFLLVIHAYEALIDRIQADF